MTDRLHLLVGRRNDTDLILTEASGDKFSGELPVQDEPPHVRPQTALSHLADQACLDAAAPFRLRVRRLDGDLVRVQEDCLHAAAQRSERGTDRDVRKALTWAAEPG
jgi:hypothetical protein